MSILCYVTFNDGGSELKGVFGEWGPMFSPESSALARSAASQWGPRPPVRAQRQRTAQLSAFTPTAPATFSTTCSSNLFKQIKSILLFHLTFIWGLRTPPSSDCLTLWRTARPASSGAHGAKSGPCSKFMYLFIWFYALNVFDRFEPPTTATTTKVMNSKKNNCLVLTTDDPMMRFNIFL